MPLALQLHQCVLHYCLYQTRPSPRKVMASIYTCFLMFVLLVTSSYRSVGDCVCIIHIYILFGTVYERPKDDGGNSCMGPTSTQRLSSGGRPSVGVSINEHRRTTTAMQSFGSPFLHLTRASQPSSPHAVLQDISAARNDLGCFDQQKISFVCGISSYNVFHVSVRRRFRTD